MKLELIQNNFFSILRKIVFFSIYFILIIVLISIKLFNTELCFIKWGLFLLLISWIVLSLFVPLYNVVGTITIFKDGNLLIESIKNGVSQVHFKSLVFYYGGYNGEMHEIEIFYTGSRSRDGTKNYLIVNGLEYQIILKNQEDFNLIISFFNDLENQGIKVKVVPYSKRKKN